MRAHTQLSDLNNVTGLEAEFTKKTEGRSCRNSLQCVKANRHSFAGGFAWEASDGFSYSSPQAVAGSVASFSFHEVFVAAVPREPALLKGDDGCFCEKQMGQ